MSLLQTNYDIIVIGGGAAGVSAALTVINRGKTVAVVTNPTETSSIYKAEMVTNYPGLPDIKGADMARLFRSQLENSGADIIPGRALSVMPLGDSFGVAVENDFYMAGAVVLATGITREKLYPGEAEFLGKGVSYCATCDGMLYRGKTVALIGSSEEAARDAEFLRSIGCTVLEFTDNGKYSIAGSVKAETVTVGGVDHPVDGIFIIKDTVSVTQLVPGLERENNAVKVSKRMETSVPGVFAAGDCVGKPYQLAKAVGEGNTAALSACEYLDTTKEK